MKTQLKRISFTGLGLIGILIVLQQCAWFQTEQIETEIIKPVPIGGYEALSTRIHYPKSVREQGLEGTVTVNAFISKTGLVTETRIAQALEPELDRIASNAIQRTLFKPALRDGQPQEVWIAIPIIYTLKDWQPRNTPFLTFEMTVMPSPSYEHFEVKMQGKLNPDVELPLRFEFLLPMNADQPWVKTGSGKIINAGTMRDESGEWLIFESHDLYLTVGFNYQPLNNGENHQFNYKLVMNQALPQWELTVIYGDQTIHFAQDPDRTSLQSDGRTRFEYDMAPQEVFEARYLEIDLLDP